MDSLPDRVGHICPVCGYDGLSVPAWSEGSPSDDICPSCGVQFGYDDMRRDEAERFARHAELREQWIAEGCPWKHSSTSPPPDWDPIEQIERLGIEIDPAALKRAGKPKEESADPSMSAQAAEVQAPLDFEATLAVLLELIGRRVSVVVRTKDPPGLVAQFVGKLRRASTAPGMTDDKEQLFFSIIDDAGSGFLVERKLFTTAYLKDWEGTDEGRSLDIELAEVLISVSDPSWKSNNA